MRNLPNTWINPLFVLVSKVGQQTPELMTQGHAGEQSLDYAVTHMPADARGEQSC
jgi:hypothetical protein